MAVKDQGIKVTNHHCIFSRLARRIVSVVKLQLFFCLGIKFLKWTPPFVSAPLRLNLTKSVNLVEVDPLNLDEVE